MTADVGVVIPGLGIIGTSGLALVVNLSAGDLVNDGAGDPVIFSVNGNHAAGSLNRDCVATADVGVVIPVLGVMGTVGLTMMVNLSAGSCVGDKAVSGNEGSSSWGAVVSSNGNHAAPSL